MNEEHAGRISDLETRVKALEDAIRKACRRIAKLEKEDEKRFVREGEQKPK